MGVRREMYDWDEGVGWCEVSYCGMDEMDRSDDLRARFDVVAWLGVCPCCDCGRLTCSVLVCSVMTLISSD